MTLRIVLPKQAQTGPTRSNIVGGNLAMRQLQPHLSSTARPGWWKWKQAWGMQMKSAKELKEEETIAQGNELIDCKEGTPQLGLHYSECHYMWKMRSGFCETEGAPEQPHSYQLCSPACCPTTFLWLQNSSLLLAFFAYFCHLCGFAQGSTGFSESQLYLFIESNAILNINQL